MGGFRGAFPAGARVDRSEASLAVVINDWGSADWGVQGVSSVETEMYIFCSRVRDDKGGNERSSQNYPTLCPYNAQFPYRNSWIRL